MKITQNYWLTICCALCLNALTSCNSDYSEVNDLNPTSLYEKQNISESEAQESFARILSLVVSKEASVRKFLKDEAIKQFDKDYDVFYPYVKERIIGDGQTFRDILVSYSSEERVSEIERSLPLLTIMVPDLSDFGAFSVEEWDTEDDQVAVTYRTGNDNSVFYAEGDSLLSLPEEDLPAFPFLVVKSNERMKVVGKVGMTRAGGEASYMYDFADPAFDGMTTKQTRASYYDETNTEQIPDDKPYMKRAEMDKRCVEAYNLYKGNNNLIDREYIYYNLSPSNSQNGILNRNIREKLYKFRISPELYQKLTMPENAQEDPHLNSEATFYKKGLPSHGQIAKDLWTDGAFEFVIDVYMGNSSLAETKTFSVRGNDLFYISKFNVRYKHKTAFRHSKWWYSTTPDKLKARWVNLSDQNFYLTKTWDLLTDPLSIYIKVFERDSGKKIRTTDSYTTTYTANTNVGTEFNIDAVKFNIGFSGGITTSKTTTISYEYADENDELGSIYFNFRDPVIISDKSVSTKGYEMYSLKTGGIELLIAPVAIR